MKSNKGIITLTLLVIIASLLAVIFLLNEDNLHFYSTQLMLRKQYVEQNALLQTLSRQQKTMLCNKLPIHLEENSKSIEFIPSQLSNLYKKLEDKLIYRFWCKKSRLFKKLPTKRIYEGQFMSFIYPQELQHFEEIFYPPSATPPLNNQFPRLYFFNKHQTHANIQGNFNGIFLAEGELELTGKGKINGTIISGGKLRISPKIAVTYNKKAIITLYQQYSRWQAAEKSWHDFQTE
ncbi:hypothetical protein BKG89_03845 [Rodentibacter caecimuris]|uniref:DUF2572 domain-containing protein n=2 Tax=Rodentibacter caecimuris TaxID=1796644 RepID=A0ABX3KZA0_9PAST|nr:hypothetical protein BKG89_03845 [Rodentibacter heylii]